MNVLEELEKIFNNNFKYLESENKTVSKEKRRWQLNKVQIAVTVSAFLGYNSGVLLEMLESNNAPLINFILITYGVILTANHVNYGDYYKKSLKNYNKTLLSAQALEYSLENMQNEESLDIMLEEKPMQRIISKNIDNI